MSALAAALVRTLTDRPTGPLAGRLAYALLALFALALFVPGIATLPPTDRDEGRFAQASKQMVETGNYVDIRYQDEARNKKPVGIYWLQAASAHAFGKDAIWPYRIPSVLGALGAVLLLAALAGPAFGRGVGLAAGGLLAASLLLTIEAHIAKTDAMLLAAIVAAQMALARVYLRARAGEAIGWGWPLVFWIAQGAGILIKGPVAPLVAALTILALGLADRRWTFLRALKPLPGLALALLVAAPWFVAVSLSDSGDFLRESVAGDLLPKLVGGQEAHGAPPGYYLLVVNATFWPAVLLGWPALIWAWRQRKTPNVRFLLAWIVPAWLAFEAVPTKLPHYILPLLPAVALLIALALRDAPDAIGRMLSHWGGRILIVVWAAVAVILALSMPVLTWLTESRIPPSGVLPLAGAAIVALVAAPAAWRGEARRAAAVAVGCTLLMWPAVFERLLPGLHAPWLSRQAALAVAQQATEWPPREPVAAVGYHEPSLVFLLGTETRLTNPDGAARYLAEARNRLALVTAREEPRFRAAVEALGARVHRIDRMSGFNTARGREETIYLYWSGEPPAR